MMRSRSLLLLLIALSAMTFASGCWRVRHARRERILREGIAADEATIRAADADFAKGAEAKDIDKCVSLYLDDAVLFSPGVPAVVGKDDIRKFFDRMLAAPSMQFSFSDVTVDVARSRDLAMDRGSFQVTVTGKDGKPATQTGRYVLVWKKQADDSWKIAADTSANTQ